MTDVATNISVRWHAFLRRRDLEQIVGSNPGVIRGPLLEIGAGAGVVTERLRELAGDVVPTDIKLYAEIEGFVCANAQDLPFEVSKFQCVFSSNVLEHVVDLDAAMSEMKRVLSDDGVMIHTMPTVTWKIVQLLLHPLGSLKSVYTNRRNPGRGLRAYEYGAQTTGEMQPARSFLTRLKDLFVAPIHGVGSSHMDEARRFSKRRWIGEFERGGLVVESSEGLFFHSPYRLIPFKFLGLRSALSRMGFATVRSYRVVPANSINMRIQPKSRTD